MANIKRFNICTRKTYQKGDEEKVQWPQVGKMVYFPANGDKNEGYKLEMNMFPTTQFFVFEETDRGQKPRQQEVIAEPEGEIDAGDVPF